MSPCRKKNISDNKYYKNLKSLQYNKASEFAGLLNSLK